MYLEIKNLVKYYQKNSPVIKKLNFSVKKGEIISFLGESGSGKTTFLKCISGLEKINSGTISLNNNILNNKNIFVKPQERKIGFVFQDYPLFPHLNLKENITFNLKPKYIKKLNYMVSLTRLENLLSRYPHELSGGEQQRACIARALIREPDLLLLDEPFSNLDSNIKFSIRDEIYKILKETNTTTILVTHDINDSLNIADRILIELTDFKEDKNKEIETLKIDLLQADNKLKQAKKYLKQYSYREVANWLSAHTGRSISHVGLMKRVKNERRRKSQSTSLRRWAEYAKAAIAKAEALETKRLDCKENNEESNTSV